MVKMGKPEIAFNKPKIDLDPYKRGAPPGTVPVGDSGFYASPNKPVDPTDCERWPGSPWCGGLPFDKRPVAIDVDTSIHPCGVDVTIGGVIGFIKTPEFQLSYRLPGECRKDPPPDEPHPEPPPTGERNAYGVWKIPNDDKIYYCFISSNYTHETLTWEYFWENAVCPSTHGYEIDGYFTGVTPDGTTGTGQLVRYPRIGDALWYQLFFDDDGKTGYYKNLSVAGSPTTTVDANVVPTMNCYLFITNYTYGANVAVLKGTGTACRTYFSKGYYVDFNPYYDSISVKVDLVRDTSCRTPNPDNNNPPPPLPPRHCDCMKCCNDASPNNDALLRQILAEIKTANKAIGTFPTTVDVFDADENKQEAQSKNQRVENLAGSVKKIVERVEKVSKIIGIDTFPLELPESVIVHPESNILQKALSFLNPFKNTKIHSVMELLVWKIKQDSAVLGQWGQLIQVQSTEKKKVTVDGKEIEKEIEKTEEVVLPNVAQTMKEQVLLQSQLMKTNGIMLDCIIKLLIDVAQHKAISAETVRRVEDIQQYLDYPTNEKTVDVPVQITFPNPKDTKDVQNDIYRLLQEGKITITFDDWTGEHSQDEKFLDLLQAAKTIQGVYFSQK